MDYRNIQAYPIGYLPRPLLLYGARGQQIASPWRDDEHRAALRWLVTKSSVGRLQFPRVAVPAVCLNRASRGSCGYNFIYVAERSAESRAKLHSHDPSRQDVGSRLLACRLGSFILKIVWKGSGGYMRWQKPKCPADIEWAAVGMAHMGSIKVSQSFAHSRFVISIFPHPIERRRVALSSLSLGWTLLPSITG